MVEESKQPILEGQHEYEYENGCRYNGNWKNNRRHGKGVFTWPSGATYDGMFMHDKRHGLGNL